MASKKNKEIMYTLQEILAEYRKACEKHPEWPSDILHQIAIVNEESGEATRAALQYVYENGSIEEVKKELIQTGAMCLRMLVGLSYENANIKDPTICECGHQHPLVAEFGKCGSCWEKIIGQPPYM